jgi:hypothetical protein
MFVGHFGVAFAAKRISPQTNVAVAILATEFIDVLWPIAILLGIEKVRIVPGLMAVSPFDFISYPWTHSLLMSIIWGIVFGAVYYAIRRDGRAAVVMGAIVVSHWVLDFLTRRNLCRGTDHFLWWAGDLRPHDSSERCGGALGIHQLRRTSVCSLCCKHAGASAARSDHGSYLDAGIDGNPAVVGMVV